MQQYKNVPIRLAPDVYAALEGLAHEEERSAVQQAAWIIRQHVTGPQPEQPKLVQIG